MKGGAQYVAKDLHDAAAADPGVEATLLAAHDVAAFPGHARVGAPLTGLIDSPSEFLLAGEDFDAFHHTAHDPRRNKVLRRFLEDRAPDVVHIHHSLWVGLDFVELVRRALPQARILYTLHDYLPICHARGQLYRAHEQAICHDWSPDQCTGCFPDRTADDFLIRRRQFRRVFAMVDRFIAPSEDLRRRYVAWGIDPARIVTVANGHASRRPPGWTARPGPTLSTFGFFGQFVDAKGIDVLLSAASIAAGRLAEADPTRTLEVRLHGGNRDRATAGHLARIDALLAAAPPNLRVVEAGPYARETVFDLMCGVDWVVVPSVWPEVFGLVVSEARDAGRPVIAARTGALAERVTDGVDGLTFAAGSAADLAAVMERCAGDAALWDRLSAGARPEVTVAGTWAALKALAL